MVFKKNANIKLELFDDCWALGDPVKIEQKLRELLPQAQALQDKSIYLQMLSQIALTQALQKQFEAAHKMLDNAEAQLTPAYDLARARILLERGRVFQQEGKIAEAKAFFERAFELSAQHAFAFHTINAAHMIAIVADKIEEKILWNQRALELAASTQGKRASDWQGSLYNNLGQNYLDAQQFENALFAFQKALEYRQKEGYAANMRVAKWAVARALRFLNCLDEALVMQQEVFKEYDAVARSENYDMPVEMFTLTRGWIYEELAEIYVAKAKQFARLAYDDLSSNKMFMTTAPERLERLKQIKDRA